MPDLIGEMQRRRWDIERLKDQIRYLEGQSRINDTILEIFEKIQESDERYVQLHGEVLSMMEMCRKVLNRDVAVTPTIFKLEPSCTLDEECYCKGGSCCKDA
jgi:hypothetical protein